ncbi:hypothetical protein LT493_16380 [Streptomyces tricolor]|nr:hypothetical protein [Streptomyces tricolor]
MLDAPLATALRKLAAGGTSPCSPSPSPPSTSRSAKLAGQDDVVVGTPVAGRSRIELEELVGCFRQHARHPGRPCG